MRCVQDIGEVGVEMRRRFIGRAVIYWCNQRKMVEWDLGTFRVLIWQCWQNKGGGYCLIRSLFFVNVLRQNISLGVTSWKLLMVQTAHMYGKVYLQPS